MIDDFDVAMASGGTELHADASLKHDGETEVLVVFVDPSLINPQVIRNESKRVDETAIDRAYDHFCASFCSVKIIYLTHPLHYN